MIPYDIQIKKCIEDKKPLSSEIKKVIYKRTLNYYINGFVNRYFYSALIDALSFHYMGVITRENLLILLPEVSEDYINTLIKSGFNESTGLFNDDYEVFYLLGKLSNSDNFLML